MPYIIYKCTYFNLKSMAFRQAVVAALCQIGNPDWSGKDYAWRSCLCADKSYFCRIVITLAIA